MKIDGFLQLGYWLSRLDSPADGADVCVLNDDKTVGYGVSMDADGGRRFTADPSTTETHSALNAPGHCKLHEAEETQVQPRRLPSTSPADGITDVKSKECLPLSAESAATGEGSSLLSGIRVEYLKDPEKVQEEMSVLCPDNVIAIDIETAKDPAWKDHEKAGLDPHLSRIRLVSLYAGQDIAWVIDASVVPLSLLKPVLENPLVAHNAVFEVKHFLHAGLCLKNICCTMLQARLLGEEPVSLQALVKKHLGIQLAKDLQTSDWDSELTQEQIEYAATDAVAAYRLYQLFSPRLEAENLGRIDRLQNETILPVARVEWTGAWFDASAHALLMDRLRPEVEELKRRVSENMRGVNLASPKQISTWLETNLSPSVTRCWPKTGSNQLQTSQEALQLHADNIPVLKDLLRLRESEKLCSTYGKKFASHVNPQTHRIHAAYWIGGARTGRFSCGDPNLQNIPNRKEFRSLFGAEPGHVLVVADFSQIELRVAAHLADETAMLKAYERNEDLHRRTAAALLGCSPEAVTKEQRQKAKAVAFGLLFGQSAKGLVTYAKSAFGVTMNLSEAEEAIQAFFRAYPELKRWQQAQEALSWSTGFATTKLGRKRAIPRGSYTTALNTPIQGSAAEVLMASLVALEKNLLQDHPNIWLTNVVHDEIILECPADNAEDAMNELRSSMEEGMRFVFPEATLLGLVDIKIVRDWSEK